jgi:hypothetical protein
MAGRFGDPGWTMRRPRFAAFGPDRLNVFIAYSPFVWLPAVLVLAALTGHLVIFGALSGSETTELDEWTSRALENLIQAGRVDHYCLYLKD